MPLKACVAHVYLSHIPPVWALRRTLRCEHPPVAFPRPYRTDQEEIMVKTAQTQPPEALNLTEKPGVTEGLLRPVATMARG